MPRDAYLSPYEIGGLSGYAAAQNIISTIALGRPTDTELIFYSSLFQAGVDRVVVIKEEVQDLKHFDIIPHKRCKILSSSDSTVTRDSVKNFFNTYLEADWFHRPEHLETLNLYCFLGDLLMSLRLGKPLLTSLALPDLAPLAVTLPLEIISPVQTLFKSVQTYDSIIAIPTKEFSKDRAQVIEEIMTSSGYTTLEEIHTELAQEHTKTESCLAHLRKLNQELYWRWKDFLRLKSSVIRVVRHLPELVEAISESSKAKIAKPLVEILSEAIPKTHGLIVYDASPLIEEGTIALLHQMIKAPQPDPEELARRVAQADQKIKSR